MLDDKERRLCETLTNYGLLEDRVQELRTQLEERTYKVTASYSLTGGIGGNGFSSKVENAAVREIQILESIEQIERRLRAVRDAMKHAPLTKTELELAECMINGEKLALYARSNGIYISHVYKIRDKMLKKMVFYIENRTK